MGSLLDALDPDTEVCDENLIVDIAHLVLLKLILNHLIDQKHHICEYTCWQDNQKKDIDMERKPQELGKQWRRKNKEYGSNQEAFQDGGSAEKKEQPHVVEDSEKKTPVAVERETEGTAE